MFGRLMLSCFIMVAFVSAGQQPQPKGEMPRFSRSLNYGNWVGKRVQTKEFMEQAGIGEEQAKKLKKELDELDAQATKLDEEINKAALEQAEIAKAVLSEPGANVDEVMKKIERIGQMRIEQAKLTTRVLIAIRDNLTPEQRKKANEIIANEGKKRMQERMLRRERDDRPHNAKQPEPARPVAPKGW